MNEEMIDTLKSADEYLGNLKNGISTMVTFFQMEEYEKACSYMVSVSKGLDWLIKAIALTQEVQKEKIEFEGLNDYFNQITEALENEDYTLVGDLFEYEITPILNDIHEKVKITVAN